MVNANIRPFSREKLIALLALSAILLLGGFLRFYQLGAYTIGNTYYAAAVKSMLASWHNFFFVAFEPGGSVTVDKPPLGFWIQTVSAYFLGVNGFSLALPQALAGTLSIALLYHLVRRRFGIWPGLAAALVLAIIPVTVATERNNTIDGLLVFTLLLAAWAFILATEKGKLRYLLLGAVLVGLGFNIKMLQAIMPLPSFYALYFFAARVPWSKRVLLLAAATIVLLVVSLAWVVAVDLTPADQRPYIGSSQNNTVLELVIGHNGLSRLGLNNRGPRNGHVRRNPAGPPNGPAPSDGGPPQNLGGNPPPQQPPPEALAACEGLTVGKACTVNLRNGDKIQGACQDLFRGKLVCLPPNRDPQNQRSAPSLPAPPTSNAQPRQTGPAGPGNQPRNGRSGEIGAAGLLRLFEEPLVTEASWLLPLALLGIPLALVALGWVWPLTRQHAGLLLWAGWLLSEMAYFSFTTGLFHRYYLIMLGPPLAALAGITVWSLIQLWRRMHLWGWSVLLVLSGFTVAYEVFTFRSYPDHFGIVAGIAILAWLAGMVLLLPLRLRSGQTQDRLRTGSGPSRASARLKDALHPLNYAGAALVGIALLAIPFAWSVLTTFNINPDVALPTAGADSMSATTFMTPNKELLGQNGKAILAYVQANTDPDGYLLAANTARGAASYILETGRPVFTFGGFTGNDAVVNLDGFVEMIESGELRYVLGLPQQKPEIVRWMWRNCQAADVPGVVSQESSTAGPRGEQNEALFDCGLGRLMNVE
ncbi:MAG: glycosyltransferase family 39 protein [Anaerolineae bacterium]|nr:glycosyltransferase family 39 protein [Anaerolineae bacterium]